MMSSDGVAGMPPSFNYTPENMQNLQRVSVKLSLIIVDSVVICGRINFAKKWLTLILMMGVTVLC